MDGLSISEATSEADFELARVLFQEYASAIGIDLCFQNFADELERIGEMYGPPGGCILFASHGQAVVGCVGLRPRGNHTCEMKRLYVRPAARARGAGRQLTIAIIERARMIGYRQMVLDTLDSMAAAKTLYRSLGFREISAYYPNPVEGVVYMGLSLAEIS